MISLNFGVVNAMLMDKNKQVGDGNLVTFKFHHKNITKKDIKNLGKISKVLDSKRKINKLLIKCKYVGQI